MWINSEYETEFCKILLVYLEWRISTRFRISFEREFFIVGQKGIARGWMKLNTLCFCFRNLLNYLRRAKGIQGETAFVLSKSSVREWHEISRKLIRGRKQHEKLVCFLRAARARSGRVFGIATDLKWNRLYKLVPTLSIPFSVKAVSFNTIFLTLSNTYEGFKN